MSADLMALAAESALFGAASGFHCMAMCGPLAACALRPGAPAVEVAGVAARYHLARAASYTLVGGLAGAVGGGVGVLASAVGGSLLRALVPWTMAALLGLQAAGVLPRLRGRPGARKPAGPASVLPGRGLPGPGDLAARAARRAALWTPRARATALGALTPLLPCGLLMAMTGVALGTRSAPLGAAAMAAFALGSALPLLAAQVGWSALQQSPFARRAAAAQRWLLAAAALTLLYRGWLEASGAGCH